jgi:predicted permease
VGPALSGRRRLSRRRSVHKFANMKFELPFFENIRQDIRFSLRGLRKNPAFTLVAVGSLALGIGANTAIFSFVNAILLKHLPVPDASRLVGISQVRNGQEAAAVFKMTSIESLAKRNTVFDGLFGSFQTTASVVTGDSPQWVMLELVTGQYFQTLQVKPALGRLMTEEDVRNAAANPVCVLSYRTWQERFGGDPAILSRSLLLNSHPYRVIGVTERGFAGLDLQHHVDLQIPVARIADVMPSFATGVGIDWMKGLSWLRPMARLKGGVSLTEAQDKLNLLANDIQAEARGGKGAGERTNLRLIDGSQGFSSTRSTFGKPILVLMAVMGIVLLAACANLASLLLARASARSKEFAVRLSLGGSRARLVRQLMIESLLLAGAGGICGLVISFWITRTLLLYLNTGAVSARALAVSPDASVLVFSILLSAATAVLFGLAPAWQATRVELAPGLKEERGNSGRAAPALFRKTLVIAQISLSLVVLFAAALLTRTLKSLQTVDLGFHPDKIIAVTVDPATSGHSSAESARIYDELLRRARQLPGVKAASSAMSTPVASSGLSVNIDVPGYIKKLSENMIIVNLDVVSPDYFATLGVPRLLGRDFMPGDQLKTPRVGIVNEKFVQHYYGGRNPVGRQIKEGDSNLEIVGVVADTRYGVRSEPQPLLYLAAGQTQTSGLKILARVDAPPEQITPSLRALVSSIDPHMPVYSIQTLETQVESGMSTERMLTYLSTLFAVLASLLAAIGLYGVISYAVTQRTREIGIRFAVGAQRTHVAQLFLRESLLLVAIGVLAGIPFAWMSRRVLGSLLYGVQSTEMQTLAASIAVLAAAGFLAIAAPLWRATRIQPVEALRHE